MHEELHIKATANIVEERALIVAFILIGVVTPRPVSTFVCSIPAVSPELKPTSAKFEADGPYDAAVPARELYVRTKYEMPVGRNMGTCA